MQPSDLELCSAVAEQAPDALIFADREGTIKLWNARAEAIFGYAAGEAIGASLDLIIPENLRAAHWRGYRQAITLGHAKTGGQVLATRATHKLGSKLYVELLGSSETRSKILWARLLRGVLLRSATLPSAPNARAYVYLRGNSSRSRKILGTCPNPARHRRHRA
jgi:PAS domain S-box-containing protein